MYKKYAVLMDFDGTISTVDIGDQVIQKFIRVDNGRQLESDFRNKVIGSAELYRRLYAGFHGNEKDVVEFVKGFCLDPYFKSFIEFCHRNEFESTVLSDGFQYYINALFDKYHIDTSDVVVYCNKAYFEPDRVTLEFPYQNPYCDICANCKAGAYIKYKDIGYDVIFIGDGFSDRYVAEKADIVFAKSHLAQYCEKNSIAYIPFDNFDDVKSTLSTMLSLS